MTIVALSATLVTCQPEDGLVIGVAIAVVTVRLVSFHLDRVNATGTLGGLSTDLGIIDNILGIIIWSLLSMGSLGVSRELRVALRRITEAGSADWALWAWVADTTTRAGLSTLTIATVATVARWSTGSGVAHHAGLATNRNASRALLTTLTRRTLDTLSTFSTSGTGQTWLTATTLGANWTGNALSTRSTWATGKTAHTSGAAAGHRECQLLQLVTDQRQTDFLDMIVVRSLTGRAHHTHGTNVTGLTAGATWTDWTSFALDTRAANGTHGTAFAILTTSAWLTTLAGHTGRTLDAGFALLALGTSRTSLTVDTGLALITLVALGTLWSGFASHASRASLTRWTSNAG